MSLSIRRLWQIAFQAGAVILCVLATVCWGQINTGKITGAIVDSTGAAITGVAIHATNVDTGASTSTHSFETGEYLLNFLSPGTYKVEGERAGFQRVTQTGVVVNAGGITRLNFALVVGEVRQTVEVASNLLAVSTETSELSKTFTTKDLDRLPNIDRNPLYQLNLMPGANNDRGSGNYGLNGGENGSAVGLTRNQLASLGGVDANANSVLIEGIANREPQNAYVGVAPPIEGIQEVQVYTGKYNAEYGFSGSAVVNVVTKAGTNEYHGALFEFLRNEKADARNFFDARKPPFKRNQFGGAFGGPIRKNKLFFFGDYQGTYYRTGSTGFLTVPTEKMYQGDFSELYDPSHAKDAAGNTWGQLYDPFTRQIDFERQGDHSH